MRTLIVEDNPSSSLLLQKILEPYGPVDVAVNGKDAIEAFKAALQTGAPYDLICMDIMMPEMDGQTALRHIRSMETMEDITNGARIVMISALDDKANILEAYLEKGDIYLPKPIRKEDLLRELAKLKLIPPPDRTK